MIDWLGHISRALILSATSAEILAILGATLSVFTVVVQSFYVVSLQKRQKKALAAMARLVLSYSSLENWNKNPGTQDRLKTMYDEVTDILDNVVATFQEIYKAKVSGAI